MNRVFLNLFCAIVFTKNAMAQILHNKDSTICEIHLSSTAILSGGNLARVVSQNRLTGSIVSKMLQFVTENSYRYGRNFTRVVENDVLTRNYLRLFPKNKLYIFVLGTYEDNFRRSIESRLQLGGGAAYNFFEKKKEFLRVSLAAVYEQAHYKTDSFNIPVYNGYSQLKAARAILRFGGVHSVLADHLLFRHDTWFMLGLQHTKNYRWHSLIGLQIPVYKGLAFKTDYEYTYESVTISKKNPFGYPSSVFDWVFSFGISYDLTIKK